MVEKETPGDHGSNQKMFEAFQDEEETARKKLRSLTEMREFHEKQMSLIERLPAGEVAWFLDSQRVRAAALIQSWWRRKRKRREGRPKIGGANRQEATRRHFPVRRFVEGKEREQLQAEIDRYRRENPPPRLSDDQMRQTHDEVQQLLGEFYSRQQSTELSSETTRDASLLRQLEEDCGLLQEAPKLGELETEKDIDPRFFTPSSQTVATMAQKMHLKEMKAAGLHS